MQRDDSDPHSLYLFNKYLLTPVALYQGTGLGVGNTGVNSHGSCPHVSFGLERREWEEWRQAGNLDAQVVNQLVYLFGWKNIFVVFFFSVVTLDSVIVIITHLVPVRI